MAFSYDKTNGAGSLNNNDEDVLSNRPTDASSQRNVTISNSIDQLEATCTDPEVRSAIRKLRETIASQGNAQKTVQNELRSDHQRLSKLRAKIDRQSKRSWRRKKKHIQPDSDSDESTDTSSDTSSDEQEEPHRYDMQNPRTREPSYLYSGNAGKDASEEASKSQNKSLKGLPFHRWVLHQLGEANFITIHYMYILFWIFLSSAFLVITGDMSYIDSLFMASSACTQGGMNT